MIVFARELICQVIDEVQPLLEAHYQELTRNKEVVKLEPRWSEYAALERMGCFVVLTARDEGALIGYNAFFVNPHMHYAALRVAQNDVFYLREDHRRGTTALRFLRWSEQECRAMGAHKLVYHCKLSNKFAPILHRLGYADEEVMCGKII
jgi:L-amino acid N-acyltransferase YncA